MNIGEALRENRERRGYTVHRLAELLDVDAQMILDWEQDKSQL